VIEIQERADGVSFLVRVQPGARRSEIAGEWEGALRIRLSEPAREGRANEALRKLLAGRLKVPAGAARIARGERGRTKRVEICGVTAVEVRAVVAPATS
jgi:uncharacterized protein